LYGMIKPSVLPQNDILALESGQAMLWPCKQGKHKVATEYQSTFMCPPRQHFALLLRARLLPIWRSVNGRNLIVRRTLVAAPKAGDGPLMERRPDRELPDVRQGGMRWALSIPIFLVVLVSSTLAIFNYQKSSSSVVAATLYALRTSPKAREVLGDNIYYAHQIPWIWGEMNQLHGKIDIQFEVKGTNTSGTMRFASHRPTRTG
ncbi:hypothetical protein DH86_00001835, partial [Scytalidium sp. 3C]